MPVASRTRKDKKARVEIGADEARQQWGALINRVANGTEVVVLTRHGAAVAALVSMTDLDKIEAA